MSIEVDINPSPDIAVILDAADDLSVAVAESESLSVDLAVQGLSASVAEQSLDVDISPVNSVPLHEPPVAEYAPTDSMKVWVGGTFPGAYFSRPTGGVPDWYKWYRKDGEFGEWVLIAETQDVEIEITPDGAVERYYLKLVCGNAYGESETVDNQIAHLVAGPPVTEPAADFVAWPLTAQVGDTVIFVQTETNHASTTYQWYANDELIGTGESLEYQFAESDVYTIKLVAENDAGQDTETKTDYITITAETHYGEPLAVSCLPGAFPTGYQSMWIYNRSSETIIIYGAWVDAGGNYLSDPFPAGDPVIPSNTGVFAYITLPSMFATLVLVPTPDVAAGELWSQALLAYDGINWIQRTLCRAHIVDDASSAITRVAAALVAYAGGFDSAFAIFNATSLNTQTERSIDVDWFIVPIAGGDPVASGSETIPPGGFFGGQASALGLSGQFNLIVVADCRANEMLLASYLLRGGMIDHEFTKFLEVGSGD